MSCSGLHVQSKIRHLRRAPTSPARREELRAEVRKACENRPGVYRILTVDGEVIYVGKSKHVRTRLLSYFRAGPDDKGSRLLKYADRIEWTFTPSEFAALLEELRLIQRLRPRHNVIMKREERDYAFLTLTEGPAPKLHVVRGGGRVRAGAGYGPFLGPTRLRAAARALGDALGLRDCAETVELHWSDQPQLFPIELIPLRPPSCIRHEIKRCLGPCIAACSRAEYRARVTLCRAFLEGTSEGPIERLRAEMHAAREALAYERAAVLRDKALKLERLKEQFDKFRLALSSLSFVYMVPGHEGEDRAYVIRRGTVRAEAPAPRTPEEAAALSVRAGEVFASHEPPRAPVALQQVDEILLVASWFRRFPEELLRTARPEEKAGG